MFSILSRKDLDELKALIDRAGAAILDVYNRAGGEFSVELKEDLTPLTQADRASNSIITAGLQRLFPGIPIISEESREIPYEVRRNFEFCWLLDPLDGTKEFLQRNGEFTINLALIHHGQPVAGFISVPCKRLLYYAVKGEGAYRIESESPDFCRANRQEEASGLALNKISSAQAVRLQAAVFSIDQPGLRVLASRSHFDEQTRAFIETLNQPVLTNCGSSLKFMMLAEGTAHLYPRLGRTMEWDTAAGQAILEEAGGQVLEFFSRRPLAYNKESLENPPFIATARLKCE
ncbi:MAG: 3'(2'),5'-bisphosphate nucleotidase CysQ [Candidatus Saccharicenans sp.]|nr:3'(2'),5'-bisphosphate nucleotidase CysQ [Candidatus Saccharicenans sp.]